METLREYRKKVNLSQRVLAESLKTTRSQIAMAERGERPLPKQAQKLFEVMQSLSEDMEIMESLPVSDDVKYANNLPLPEDYLVVSGETLGIWQEKVAENQWQIYYLKKKLVKMKAEAASLTARQMAFGKLTVAIPQTGGKDIEVEYFKDKQQLLNRKILTCGRIAQLRLQLSIDLLLAEADLLNQYVASATAAAAVSSFINNHQDNKDTKGH